jgi:hypothetical protein
MTNWTVPVKYFLPPSCRAEKNRNFATFLSCNIRRWHEKLTGHRPIFIFLVTIEFQPGPFGAIGDVLDAANAGR